MAAGKRVGQPLKLSEDPLPLTGQSSLLADLRSQNVYHAAILRGSYDHTHICKVGPSQALRMPGVADVTTGTDATAMTHRSEVGSSIAWRSTGAFAGEPVTFFGRETKGKAPDGVVVGSGHAAASCPRHAPKPN